jgi:hypothetical protein
MVNRRANSVMFGFDFQVNAAIVLMLKNIKELSSLKLEGEYEDIELKLEDGSYILAQAKGIEAASSDFRNVRKNLKKALNTLSEGSRDIEVRKLILITNSLNPLNEETNIFFGESYRDYNTLPPSSKKIIDNYLDEINESLDREKFMIQVLPFETDNEEERYKVVRQKVDSFIGMLDLSIPGVVDKILGLWQNNVFTNGAKKDSNIKLEKRAIIWPIICIVTDVDRHNHESLNIDDELYEEVIEKYREIVTTYSEKFELFTKVLYDYNNYKSDKISNNEKIEEFIITHFKEYRSDLKLENSDEELEETLIKVILFNILRSRRIINRIKERVKL